MVAFNFQARFADDVKNGVKRQTIRARRKDVRQPCHPGDALQLYTGMRHKNCCKLRDAVCKNISVIQFQRGCLGGLDVVVEGMVAFQAVMVTINAEKLATADGFDDAEAMAAWFEKIHGLPFIGWLIEWEFPCDG